MTNIPQKNSRVHESFPVQKPDQNSCIVFLHKCIMYKATCCKRPGFKIFLNVAGGGMVAWENIFASAERAFIKINVNGLVYLRRCLSEMPLVSKQSSQLFWIFIRLFLLIFLKRSLESLDKFCLKLGSGFFKFFDLRLKFPDLEIGKVHGELKVVNAFAQISFSHHNRIGRFTFEKYAEFVERAKRMFDPTWIMALFFLPAHGVFPYINIVITLKHKEMHPALFRRSGGICTIE